MNQGPRRTPALAVLLIGCAGAATDEQPAGPPAFVVRDSAGVLISENSDSSWTQQTAWRIEQDPTLEIGSRSGDVPGTDFGRIGPVLRFPDGRIAVGDIQALEIRLFSPDGGYLGSWARRGAGPGELQRLDRLALIGGDSLVARNDGIFRHDIFGPDGVWGRTVLAPPSSWLRGGGGAVAWLADGAFIHGPANIDQRDLLSVRQTLMGEYHLFDSVGEHSANLGRLPDRWVEKHDGVVLPTTVSYGPLARIADAGDGLWYGFPSTFELRHIGMRCRPNRQTRLGSRRDTAAPEGAVPDMVRGAAHDKVGSRSGDSAGDRSTAQGRSNASFTGFDETAATCLR